MLHRHHKGVTDDRSITTLYHPYNLKSSNTWFSSFSGGYYTIEQKERKLRIIILNTNLWIGKEPRTSANGGSVGSVNGGGVINSYVYNNNGGVVISASSSANYNSEQDEEGRLQWEWLESVLAKSYQNRETVRNHHISFIIVKYEIVLLNCNVPVGFKLCLFVCAFQKIVCALGI